MVKNHAGKAHWTEGPEDRLEGPKSGNTSKERGGTEDSRATARLGEERDGPSSARPANGEVARIAAHEAAIQHIDLPTPGPALREKKPRRPGTGQGSISPPAPAKASRSKEKVAGEGGKRSGGGEPKKAGKADEDNGSR